MHKRNSFQYILSITTFVLSIFSVTSTCLHKGCVLTDGLLAKDIDQQIRVNLHESEQEENVIRVMTWNVLEDEIETGEDTWDNRKSELCDYIKRIRPAIIGLQEVEPHQLDDLKRCLKKEYIFVAGKTVSHENVRVHNPILIRKNSQLKLVQSGTFWLSNTPNHSKSTVIGTKRPRIATWVELSLEIPTVVGISRDNSTHVTGYHQKPKANVFDDILYILKKFTINLSDGTNNKPTAYNRRVERIFVASTHLDYKDVLVAKRQLNHLQYHLLHRIMNRRRYKVLLMGDFNWEDNTAMYEHIVARRWMSDTQVSARKSFPALTKVRLPSLIGRELIDYIFEDKFDTVLAGALMDLRSNGRLMSDHRPVFAALLP